MHRRIRAHARASAAPAGCSPLLRPRIRARLRRATGSGFPRPQRALWRGQRSGENELELPEPPGSSGASSARGGSCRAQASRSSCGAISGPAGRRQAAKRCDRSGGCTGPCACRSVHAGTCPAPRAGSRAGFVAGSYREIAQTGRPHHGPVSRECAGVMHGPGDPRRAVPVCRSRPG